MNDQFQVEQDKKREEFASMGFPEEEVNILIEDPSLYENFYVPERARWSHLNDLTLNIGPELDKAFKAIEDEPKNAELIGVLTSANYNDKERVPDKKLSQLLILFSEIPLQMII
jgi:type I restriction enzyme M protein